jgi:hypothetical protein
MEHTQNIAVEELQKWSYVLLSLLGYQWALILFFLVFSSSSFLISPYFPSSWSLSIFIHLSSSYNSGLPFESLAFRPAVWYWHREQFIYTQVLAVAVGHTENWCLTVRSQKLYVVCGYEGRVVHATDSRIAHFHFSLHESSCWEGVVWERTCRGRHLNPKCKASLYPRIRKRRVKHIYWRQPAWNPLLLRDLESFITIFAENSQNTPTYGGKSNEILYRYWRWSCKSGKCSGSS